MFRQCLKVCLAICLCSGGTVLAGGRTVSLNGAWTLEYRHQQEGGAWTRVAATVPGNVNLDLQRAGLVPDPEIGTNVYAHLPLEQNEWRYSRRFGGIEPEPGGSVVLRFGGVDTRAEYFLNGERLGASENMFVPVEFDVTGRLRGDNELVVRIRSALGGGELGVLGRRPRCGTDGEYVRKAQHAFGWDIMPRLLTAGVWRGVTLEARPAVRFADLNFIVKAVDPRLRWADCVVDSRIDAPWRHLHRATLRLRLVRGGKVAWRKERPLHDYQTRDAFRVGDADLWWPRDAGESALYDLTVEFVDETGVVRATASRKVGLRTVELERRDWAGETDPGTFRFLVNGTPVYVHGCNVTPMDALHARDPQHLAKCCEMLADLNCNMVRSWGGGVYEDDAFFDFCDANGILVWQDFCLSNAQPVQRDDFARAVEAEALVVVKRLRGHASLAIWCGNNEIDRQMVNVWGRRAPDPDRERISREVLPRVLREFDPFTPYLPSSPLWSNGAMRRQFDAPSPDGRMPLSQDHLWGPREQYFKGAFWTRPAATFVSETGVHGCPNLVSLKRMMTPGKVYPWPDPKNPLQFNDEWNCKSVVAFPDQARSMGSSRNALMSKQVKTFFGSVPEDLATFVDQSQIYQAEALKCWVGTFRCRKGRTWGMLWWNLRDGWPIVSDGVVDYYFGKKRAYDVLKTVQQPQLVQLCDGAVSGLMAVNDRLYPVKGHVTAIEADSGRTLYDADVTLPANAAVKLADSPVGLTGQGLVRLVYTFEGVCRENRCLYGAPPFDYARVRAWLPDGSK